MIDLKTLPSDHPLRNKPLLGALTRWEGASSNAQWKKVEATWPISKVTFNELATPWTNGWDWMIKE